MVEYCLKDCITEINPDINSRPLNVEIRRLLDGSLQRQWRLKGDKKFDPNSLFAELPLLKDLALRLMALPASSSSVERLFSKHCHTWIRNRAGEDTVEDQLGLNTFLAHQGSIGQDLPARR